MNRWWPDLAGQLGPCRELFGSGWAGTLSDDVYAPSKPLRVDTHEACSGLPRCLSSDESHPCPIRLDIVLQAKGCVARVVITLDLPILGHEVEHAAIARDLKLLR